MRTRNSFQGRRAFLGSGMVALGAGVLRARAASGGPELRIDTDFLSPGFRQLKISVLPSNLLLKFIAERKLGLQKGRQSYPKECPRGSPFINVVVNFIG